MKKGFVSTAIVYSFLIIFLMIVLSLLNSYLNRNNYINIIIDEVKQELNGGTNE